MVGVGFAVSSPAGSLAPGDQIPELMVKNPGQMPTLADIGERIDLERGGTMLIQTDVDLPGSNDLPVRITRSRGLTSRDVVHHHRAGFGDWALEIPRITMTGTEWSTSKPGQAGNRCSMTQLTFAPPPSRTIAGPGGALITVPGGEYWSAPILQTDSDSGALLAPVAGAQTPADGRDVKWTTRGRTAVSCLGSVRNVTGEGYFARTAEGRTYRFDWMAKGEILSMPPPYQAIRRFQYSLYASRVEDRFGNWVEYDFAEPPAGSEGVLVTAVRASDGRRIDIQHDGNGLVTSISANGRTWQYRYHGPAVFALWNSLNQVILPDGSSYQFEDGGTNTAYMSLGSGTMSSPDVNVYSRAYSYAVVQPSGARVKYSFDIRRFGRTNIPAICNTCSPRVSNLVFSLIEKRRTGPGLPEEVWSYAYDSKYGFAPFNDGYSQTTVTGPDGARSRYTYGNSYEANEGLLLAREDFSAGNVLLASTRFTYGLPSGEIGLRAGYHPRAWTSGKERRLAFELSDDTLRPLQRSVMQRDGMEFEYRVESVDAVGRPVRVVESSRPH